MTGSFTEYSKTPAPQRRKLETLSQSSPGRQTSKDRKKKKGKKGNEDQEDDLPIIKHPTDKPKQVEPLII